MPKCGMCGGAVPVFASSGRARQFCLICQPKPIKKSRKPYTLREIRRLICANQKCAGSFVAVTAHQRFCCGKCRNTVNNLVWQESCRNRSERACSFCGERFCPSYGDMRQKFCSKECRVKFSNKNKSGNTHRRRAKKYGGVFCSFDKKIVFDRDGWRCRACWIATPPERQGLKTHDAPELDHVVPLSAGGDHSIENTQCLCRSCNSIKGRMSMRALLERLAA